MRVVAAAAIAVSLTPVFAAAEAAGPRPVPPVSASAINDVVFVRPPAAAAARVIFAPPLAEVAEPAFSPRWSETLVLGAGGVGISFSPHAALGASEAGRTAEAGATVRIGAFRQNLQARLRAMGVKDGAAAYGDQGRFYLFAAVRGQAVGLNLQAAGGALRRAGWSTDASSALVGDGQVGVGWRKGGLEADLGYVHRGIKVRNAPLGASDSYADDMAALSLTFRPRW